MAGTEGGSRLFHAIVVVGLAFGGGGCGGQTASSTSGDAAAGGAGDATSGGHDGAPTTDAFAAADAASLDAPSADAVLALDANGASDAGGAADAYGYPDDAGNCVCPPQMHRAPAPCCAPGYGACTSWPCYI